MARRAHAYPQVEPGAAGEVDTSTVLVPRTATVDAALTLARRVDAAVLTSASGAVVLRADLVKARELGLGHLAAEALARPVPIVDARASEVLVRRHVAAGAPAVLVRDRGAILGAVTRSSVSGRPSASMRRRLASLPPDIQEGLRSIARLASEQGARAWLVGGVVRDLFGAGDPHRGDLDVVVEGDAPALAERLAHDLGGRLVVHPRFLTASVEASGLGVIDVDTARSERYETAGALPRVMPATIRADLARRDFAVNAMAIELTADEAALLDPFGGRGDLARRRLRILHPLSFVEDPTRIVRAARYAARLGLTADTWTRRCRRLALGLVPYPALSGQRVLAELALVLRDAKPEVALRDLGQAGGFRLLEPRYRFTRKARALLLQLAPTRAWVEARGLGVRPVDLALLVLLADQRPEVPAAALHRLGIDGEPRRQLETAWAGHEGLRQRLAAADRPSQRAQVLRGHPPLMLAWLHLAGDAQTRKALDWWTSARHETSVLRGDDVVELGIPRGPAVARVLEALRDAGLDGTVTGRDAETAYVRRWREARDDSQEGKGG